MTGYRIDCGRTINRGNWVSVTKNGYSVHLSDDHEKAIPQIQLKDKALEILNEWLQSEAE